MSESDINQLEGYQGYHRVCKCECGGWVIGVYDFGQLWTVCDKCTPVVKVRWNERGNAVAFIE